MKFNWTYVIVGAIAGLIMLALLFGVNALESANCCNGILPF